jgi:hypothetical protein
VLRVAGRASNRHGAFNHVGVANSPFVDLLRAHGAADYQGQPFDAEMLGDQSVQGLYVFFNAHPRKERASDLGRRIAREAVINSELKWQYRKTATFRWLDYAVDIFDALTADLEHLFDDVARAPTQDEVHAAARAELNPLRRATEPVDIKALIGEGRV